MIWIKLIIAYLIFELIINIIFRIIDAKLEDEANPFRSIIKGILERVMMIAGLLAGYPQILIAFGAIKIGTRFQKGSKVSNDYFLVGNFISILAAILLVQYAIHTLGFVSA